MVSFSGPEAHFSRLLNNNTIQHDEIAYATLHCVAKSLVLLMNNIIKQYPIKKLLIVGGVASNNQIRSYLTQMLSKADMDVYFANPRYCSDNAVGIATLGLNKYLQEKRTI